eukprot:m.44526 g.44526  ORF g.44526 m.44526 type:complete len:293 (-) comp7178_c1_seq1:432-1310(-)
MSFMGHYPSYLEQQWKQTYVRGPLVEEQLQQQLQQQQQQQQSSQVEDWSSSLRRKRRQSSLRQRKASLQQDIKDNENATDFNNNGNQDILTNQVSVSERPSGAFITPTSTSMFKPNSSTRSSFSIRSQSPRRESFQLQLNNINTIQTGGDDERLMHKRVYGNNAVADDASTAEKHMPPARLARRRESLQRQMEATIEEQQLFATNIGRSSSPRSSRRRSSAMVASMDVQKSEDPVDLFIFTPALVPTSNPSQTCTSPRSMSPSRQTRKPSTSTATSFLKCEVVKGKRQYTII